MEPRIRKSQGQPRRIIGLERPKILSGPIILEFKLHWVAWIIINN